MYRAILLLAVFACVECQTKEGDSCTDDTNRSGRCTPYDKCQSAKKDYNQGGIRPTFCVNNGTPLVCCRDGANVQQGANTNTQDRPVWGTSSSSSNNKRRVCERKCEEYSRGVVDNIPLISLIPDPELLSISAAKCDYNGVELIVGGEDAKQGEFPHMAAIGWAAPESSDPYTFDCGGSLISPKFVLTAGHCLEKQDTTKPVIVRLGDQNIDPSVNDGAKPIDAQIRRTHKHPEYNPPITYNDIGLLELANDVSFNKDIRPACLWTQPGFGSHSKAIATGWGVVDDTAREKVLSKELQKVSLSLLQNDFCDPKLATIQNRNWDGFRDTQLCAGELRGGKDTCQGDSGSPLQVASSDNQCIFYVIGVTSFGRSCGESDRPAIYSRVAAYIPWIESIVWPAEA